MSAVDFEAWAAPNLQLKLGGVVYTVTPPSVRAAGQVLAAAVYGEVALGIAPGPVPDEIQRVVDEIGDEHPALGEAYWVMEGDGVAKATIDRAAYYATFYWARGKEYADFIATLLFAPRVPVEGSRAPKARARSPRKSGRSTASAK